MLRLGLYPLARESALRFLGELTLDQHLVVERDYRIFGQLRDDIEDVTTRLRAHPLPQHLRCGIMTDEGERLTRTDAYGNELTYLYSGELKQLEFPEDTSPRNKAVKVWLDALPDDLPIILMWV